MSNKISFVFAGDRDIGFWVLNYIIKLGFTPKALLLSSQQKASHNKELRSLCPFIKDELIFYGKQFYKSYNISKLSSLDLDYIICIHFPFIIPPQILDIPKIGVLNLHPAYLPYNRGWHTPSWAILDNTPIGATLHFMDEGLDTGNIILQRKLEIFPYDTADSLYHRIKKLEFDIFKEAWPSIVTKNFEQNKQNQTIGKTHYKKDLLSEEVQKIDLEKLYFAEYLINHLRALTTNDLSESVYFVKSNKKYRVQIKITEE